MSPSRSRGRRSSPPSWHSVASPPLRATSKRRCSDEHSNPLHFHVSNKSTIEAEPEVNRYEKLRRHRFLNTGEHMSNRTVPLRFRHEQSDRDSGNLKRESSSADPLNYCCIPLRLNAIITLLFLMVNRTYYSLFLRIVQMLRVGGEPVDFAELGVCQTGCPLRTLGRYCRSLVVRRPRTPFRSRDACQDTNSSTDKW